MSAQPVAKWKDEEGAIGDVNLWPSGLRLSITTRPSFTQDDGTIIVGIDLPIEVIAEILPEEVKDAFGFYAREANYDDGSASSEAGARAREALRKLGLARIKVVRGPEFNTLHFECICGARWIAPEDDVPPPDETECPNCVGFFKTKVEDGS